MKELRPKYGAGEVRVELPAIRKFKILNGHLLKLIV
jgi:hypothetical protein